MGSGWQTALCETGEDIEGRPPTGHLLFNGRDLAVWGLYE